MALVPVNVEQFGGLNLSGDPAEVGLGQAVDLLNVDFDRRGRVRSRDGYLKMTAAAGATRYDSVFPLATATSTSSSAAAPGTMTDVSSGIGSTAWTSTALPTASVTLAAATSGVTVTPKTSRYLKATNFGFAIPATATILGVVASITRTSSSSYVFDASCRLVKGGTISGNDPVPYFSALWSASASYGGSSDLWGLTLTPTDINASTFGVVIAASNFDTTTSRTATVSAISLTVFYQALGNVFVAGAASSRLDVVATDGTVAATVATASDEKSSYVAFGSPSATATYIANRGTTIRKLAGTTFSTPAGMPKAKFVGLQTPDNRLVAANIATIPTGAGSTASTSLVHFSGAGTPETWGANDYVYLSPGDNEDIQGIATWREQTFVFKSTRFFVFYGNRTDGAGASVFNYRQITGAGVASAGAVTASPDGVYFVDRSGIFFTSGGPPVGISGPVDPLFTGGVPAFFTPGAINPSAFGQITLAWFSGRLYAGLPLGVATANSHTLVFDPATGEWTLWDIPMGAMAASLSQPGVLLFTYATGTNDVGQWLPNAYTTDNGTAISSRYRSGLSDLGGPGVEKTVRQAELVGQGAPSFGWYRDFGAITSSSTATVAMGTAPATARALHRLAQNGELLGWQVSATSAWQLNRLTPMVRPFRQPGDKTS